MPILFFQNDVEIPVPKYYINEKMEILKEREKLLGQILTKAGPQDKEDVSDVFYLCCEIKSFWYFKPGTCM